jgi:hypothetical protein
LFVNKYYSKRHNEINVYLQRKFQFERKLSKSLEDGFKYAIDKIVRDKTLQGKIIMILSDADFSAAELLYPQITNLTSLDESVDLSNYVFLVYFKFDSEALIHLRQVVLRGGVFFPFWSAFKTPLRHRQSSVYESVYATYKMQDRLSHLNKIDSINIQENICEALELTKDLDGAYIEIGCYMGTTSFTAATYIKLNKFNRPVYLTDTFSGFSMEHSKISPDRLWEGHLVSKSEGQENYVKETFANSKLNVVVYKSDICSDPIHPDISSIVVANIDVDQFEATYDALIKVHNLLVVGGIIVLEDTVSTPLLYGAMLAKEKFLDVYGRDYYSLSKQTQDFLIKMR